MLYIKLFHIMDEVINEKNILNQENPIKYNESLMLLLTNLREKRENVNKNIVSGEEEKSKITKDIHILDERLQKVNGLLDVSISHRNEYDKTIQETEAAYMKILESSRTLLDVLNRETSNLTNKDNEK